MSESSFDHPGTPARGAIPDPPELTPEEQARSAELRAQEPPPDRLDVLQQMVVGALGAQELDRSKRRPVALVSLSRRYYRGHPLSILVCNDGASFFLEGEPNEAGEPLGWVEFEPPDRTPHRRTWERELELEAEAQAEDEARIDVIQEYSAYRRDLESREAAAILRYFHARARRELEELGDAYTPDDVSQRAVGYHTQIELSHLPHYHFQDLEHRARCELEGAGRPYTFDDVWARVEELERERLACLEAAES